MSNSLKNFPYNQRVQLKARASGQRHIKSKYLHVVETGVYILLDTAHTLFLRPKTTTTAGPEIEFSLAPSHLTTLQSTCARHLKHIYIPAPLRGGGVSFVGLSLLFEYTVVPRGWSRIASDVFRPVSRAQRDAEVVLGGNAHHPGLDLTFEWYHRANRAFSPPHANTEERALLATDNMDLHILDHRLRVTSISKNGLVNFTHPLIKLLFLRNRTR